MQITLKQNKKNARNKNKIVKTQVLMLKDKEQILRMKHKNDNKRKEIKTN